MVLRSYDDDKTTYSLNLLRQSHIVGLFEVCRRRELQSELFFLVDEFAVTLTQSEAPRRLFHNCAQPSPSQPHHLLHPISLFLLLFSSSFSYSINVRLGLRKMRRRRRRSGLAKTTKFDTQICAAEKQTWIYGMDEYSTEVKRSEVFSDWRSQIDAEVFYGSDESALLWECNSI